MKYSPSRHCLSLKYCFRLCVPSTSSYNSNCSTATAETNLSYSHQKPKPTARLLKPQAGSNRQRNMSTASGNPGYAATSAVHPSLWNLGKLNHVAIACPDLEQATSFYRDILGGTTSEPIPLPDHGVYTVFVDLGNTKIELLHPLGDKSPIQGFLDKNKNGGIHHVCIEVDNLKEAMDAVRRKGVRCLTENPAVGAHGKPVVFLHPKDCGGVLLELEEM